jgi:hypothetical protein
MKFSKEAEKYWSTQGIRFLADNNAIPTIEERVKAAYDSALRKKIAYTISIGNYEQRLAQPMAVYFPSKDQYA